MCWYQVFVHDFISHFLPKKNVSSSTPTAIPKYICGSLETQHNKNESDCLDNILEKYIWAKDALVTYHLVDEKATDLDLLQD